MFQAILFDLDDTLLRNEMNAFVSAYWGTLLPKIAAVFPDHDIKKAVSAGTQAMMTASRSKKTLREIFIAAFEQATRLDFRDVEPVFMDYYHNEYRGIQKVTQPVPGAREALERAAAITETIVLATIPIFPLVAIEERLRWAGLDDFPFAFITSFELMHASKPNPQYYAEIAKQVGCEPEACLMIGNDLLDDMSAKEVGMTTFLVTDYAQRKNAGQYVPDHEGSMQELIGFLNP